MKQINCIAIDDEPIALLVIKQFCERKGNIELKTFCEPRIGCLLYTSDAADE